MKKVKILHGEKNFTDRQGADIMTIQECYTKLKGNYEDAVRRLSSDNLIERFMLMFPKDTTMQALRAAVAEGNIEESFRAAHTLKGIAANLSFSELAEVSSKLTEQLRPRTNQADGELVSQIEELYELTINTLKEYQASK